MFSVLPSELLLSEECPHPHQPTSSLSFLCSQTPLRQGYKIADILWFTWTRMRQTGGGRGGGSQIVCEREMEESLSNSPGPLILHTCFPQNFCILPRAGEIRRWGGKGAMRGSACKDFAEKKRATQRVEKSGIKHEKRFWTAPLESLVHCLSSS